MTGSIDFSPRTVDGGFFLHKDRDRPPFAWNRDQDQQFEIVGTIEGNESTIRGALIDLIRGAKRRLFLASFLIGDDDVVAELIRAAKRMRGGVYVICALGSDSIERGLALEGEEGVPPEERQKDFRRLSENGVFVRGHENCHAKFAVCDGAAALVGSANFVRNSFELNNELSVVIRDPVQVDQAARLFTQIWYQGCEWEVPPGDVYRIARRTPVQPPRVPAEPDGAGSAFVWTNTLEQTHLLRAIHGLIDDSKGDLTLASYSIVGMSDDRSLLLDHIERAIARGVAVRLHVRQRNARPREMTDVLAAHDLGVQIHGDIRNHAKVAIADRTSAVVFSANFDAEHGLVSGVEAGVRLCSEVAVSRVVDYFDYLIETANTEFVRDPPIAELDQRLAARWRSPWDGSAALLLHGSEARRFAGLCAAGACLFERSGGDLRLFVGDVCAELRVSNADDSADLKSIHASGSVHDRLQEWMKGVRNEEERQGLKRGFFPARLSFAD